MSFSDGLFSESMLVSGSVASSSFLMEARKSDDVLRFLGFLPLWIHVKNLMNLNIPNLSISIDMF